MQKFDDPSISHILDTHLESKKLYIIFGGIGGKTIIPVFEFIKSTAILNHNKIFVRDISRSWYLNGIDSNVDNVHKLSLFLFDIIKNIKPIDVIFVGCSMGGFGAILLHSIMKIGRVIVFSPQTFICERLRLEYNDNRWPEWIAPLNVTGLYDENLLDLTLFSATLKPSLNVTIHVCSTNRLDYIHAKIHEKMCGSSVIEYDFGGHALVKDLRDKGLLTNLIS